MRARVASLLPTIALLLAGCSDGGGTSAGADADGPGASSSASSSGPAAAPPVVLAPIEIYNDSIAFARPGAGGSPGQAQASMPAGYGNLTVHYAVRFECPAGTVQDVPRLDLEANGVVTSIWTYDAVAPVEPYSCPAAHPFFAEHTGDATTVAAGGVTVSTAGAATAEARIVLVAKP